jgi:hypothetical protein
MNVLQHGESRWGVDDFDLPLLSIELSTPQFLQPVHEPQMRLPSLFTPWENRFTASIPVAMSSFDRRPSFERLNILGVSDSSVEPVSWNTTNRAVSSPSATSDHLGKPATERVTLPSIKHASHTPADPNCDHHTETAILRLEERNGSQQHQSGTPWKRLNYDNTWESEGLTQFDQHEEPHVGNRMFPPSAAHDLRPEDPCIHRQSESVTAISAQHYPTALPEGPREGLAMSNGTCPVPISESIIHMPPPPRKRNHKFLVLEDKTVERRVYASAKHEQDAEESQRTRASFSKSSQDTPGSRKLSRGRADYVHSLCGKSFSERSKVKKHHWGNKNDDLKTTTGCWHKHKRPNVSWDDHRSCKSVPRPGPHKSRRARSATEDPKAPVVQAMVPDYRNVAPGYPILQELPHTYTRAVKSPHTLSSFTQDGPMHSSLMQERNVPYHSHGLPRTTLPPSSPFESLLTAVNVAAKTDEPTPKGRNDSVVICELDAQAVAAERTGQYTPAWVYTPGCQDDDYQSRHYVPFPTDNSFGVGSPSTAQYMPFDMGFSQTDNTDYATPNASLTLPTPVYADQYAFMQSDEGDAAEQGFGLHPVHD